MTRMDQPEDEIIHPGPTDEYRPLNLARDDFERRPPRRSSQHIDDDLARDFQRFDLGEKRDGDKVRRNSIIIEPGKIIRRRSSSGGKRDLQNFELYQFERSSDDWTIADRIRITAPQDELQRRVKKGKSRISVIDAMSSMHPNRRGQINRLVDQKNDAENDRDAEWVPVLIEKKKQAGKKILIMDVIVAKSFRPGRPASRGKRTSFIGDKSDLREPLRAKSKDRYKSKDKDKYKEKEKARDKKKNDYDHDHNRDPDFFGEERLFTPEGHPIENHWGPVEGENVDRRPLPLEDPIAGPPPGLRPPPAGWNEPLPPEPNHNQGGPIELITADNFQPQGAQAGNGVLDLDQLLENPGGGDGAQNFDQPAIEDFGPRGANRSRSGGRRKSGSRSRPKKIYTDQAPYREHRRRYQYGDSSIDDEDEVSVFFDGEDMSSMSSVEEEHGRLIPRRGSLKRRPSMRREQALYREHRRGASYDLGRRDMIIEPGRTPRRPGPERRQTIAYVEPRQITYPYRSGRDRDPIDEPLSPVLTHRSYSPPLPARRDNRVVPPEVFYPDEWREKNRRAELYMDTIDQEARFREAELRRLERELDEREAIRREREAIRRGGGVVYRYARPERLH